MTISPDELEEIIQPLKYDPKRLNWSWNGRSLYEILKFNPPEGKCALKLLEANSRSSLKWDNLLDSDLIIKESQMPQLLWQLETDFWPMKVPMTEEGIFRMHKMSLEHFNKQIWQQYRSVSLGVIMTQVDFDPQALLSGFYWDLEQIEQLSRWLDDHGDPLMRSLSVQVKEFWCNRTIEAFKEWSCSYPILAQYVVQLLNQYWHYLASSLEDDCFIWIRINAHHMDLALQIQLLAHAGKEHLYLISKNAHPSLTHWIENDEGILASASSDLDIKLGIVLPTAANLGPLSCKQLAKIMTHLDQAKIVYRLLDEAQLANQWTGIDEMIVLGQHLTGLGVRMIKGFCAAMGKIYLVGSNSALEHLKESSPHWMESLDSNS
jgi:hypothetical protein